MNDSDNERDEKNSYPPELNSQEEQGNFTALSSLLKAPGFLIRSIERDKNVPVIAVQLLLWGLVFHAIFGGAMALFDSREVALMTAGKAPLIALASLLLCMPSLYVFSCVAGMPVTITQTFGIAAAALAMTGLLLLGLTPVSWLFSVSTNNLAFVVVMNILAWGIAVGFVTRFFRALGLSKHFSKTAGLKWWLLIYIIVSLQMATTMRPLLGKPENGWRNPEKKFFLAHLKDSLSEQPKTAIEPAGSKLSK